MLDGMTPPKNRAVYCKVDQLAQSMKESDRVIFMDAIDDQQSWPANTLSNSLRQRGVSVADVTISKHRLQACACYRG